MESVRRAVLGEVGASGADEVVRAAARLLRDGGVEVVQLGAVEPAAIAEVALQEDAGIIGLPVGSGATAVAEVTAALADRGLSDVVVVALGEATDDDWLSVLSRRLAPLIDGQGTPG